MNAAKLTVENHSEHEDAVANGRLGAPPLIRRAFILAPASLDTSVIREALTERGVTSFGIEDVPGDSIPIILQDCLGRADLVIAVLGSGGQKSEVYFELGFAVAMQKRILVLAARDENLSMYAIPCLRIDPTNKEGINFGLDQILHAPEIDSRGGRSPQQTKPIGRLADDLLEQVRSRGQLSEREILRIVGDVLGASGIESKSISPKGDAVAGGVDIAVWSDDFEPWIGNPLVIEIRAMVKDSAALAQVVNQMEATLTKTSTEWGLLICQLGDFIPGEEWKDSRVLLATVEGLLEMVREQSLGNILAGLRNRRVHGKG